MASFALSCEIGARVCDLEGYKATIRYIGPVVASANKEEVWFGVEWDNPSRGKHDGSCVDATGISHRYFQCSPTSGSFIRPVRLSQGVGLAAALAERYVAVDGPTVTDNSQAGFCTSKGNIKPIEFVGEQKLRSRQQLKDLFKVSARNANISMIDAVPDAGHLQEIDLQDNLLYRWEERSRLTVAQVFKLSTFPHLSCLLLHGNKLLPLSPDTVPATFPALRVLALNACNITWKTVLRLQASFPLLEELYLAHNPLEVEVEVEDQLQLDLLKVLDLTACEVRWEAVGLFGEMPALQEMILDYNPIDHVEAREEGAFAHLTRMSLAHTQLTAWSDIDNLNTFHISVLRLSNVPLFTNKGASEVRPFVIARLDTLSMYNGSVVSGKERTNSEKMYLKSIMAALPAAGSAEGSAATTALIHPRYPALHALYGEEIAPAAVSAAGSVDGIVNVIFRNLSFGSGGTLEPIAKKLPKSITIQRLQLLVKSLYGLAPALQKLSLRVYKDAPPVLLEDEEATLQYYGVIDGAEIFVNE